MTTSLTHPAATDFPGHPPADASSDPWAGLTEDDATRIAATLAATHAETTCKVYAFAWRRWVRWCSGRGIVPFPAEPAAVCAYLTECAEHVVGRRDAAGLLRDARHARPAIETTSRRHEGAAMSDVEETGQIAGTKDKDYNILWFTEQSMSNALRLETYAADAERAGDQELAAFFRKAQSVSRKGGDLGKKLLAARIGKDG
jgi:hypothetical protein